MRLIDADALRETVEFHPTSASVCMTAEEARGRTAQKLQCLEDIDDAPTIPAIPIDWLEKLMHEGEEDDSKAAWRVLRTWKNEQEANNGRIR